jgi:hypothetical protein
MGLPRNNFLYYIVIIKDLNWHPSHISPRIHYRNLESWCFLLYITNNRLIENKSQINDSPSNFSCSVRYWNQYHIPYFNINIYNRCTFTLFPFYFDWKIYKQTSNISKTNLNGFICFCILKIFFKKLKNIFYFLLQIIIF